MLYVLRKRDGAKRDIDHDSKGLNRSVEDDPSHWNIRSREQRCEAVWIRPRN